MYKISPQAVEQLEKTKEEMAKLENLKKQLEERNVMLERELGMEPEPSFSLIQHRELNYISQ